MFERSRGAVALLAALVMVGVASTAAVASPSPSSTTTASTTTTIGLPNIPPPPAPFALPLDLGLQLLQQRNEASQDINRLGSALPGDRAQAQAVERQWNALQRRFVRLVAKIHRTQHNLDVAHASLEAAAVDAYMNAGSSRLEAAITAIASANSAMEAGRTMHLIGSFGDQQDELVHEYVALEKRLGRERKELTKQRAEADVQLASAKQRVV